MFIDWQILGPWAMVAILGFFVVRAMLRGEVAADALQREIDAEERYKRELLSWGWQLAMLARGCCPDATLPLPPIAPNGKPVPPLTRDSRVKMRQTLADRLSIDELRDLGFDLGMPTEEYNSRAALARALVEHIDKHHLADLARARVKDKRPDVEL